MMTLDELRKLPLQYMMGMSGAKGASRLYRNNEYGIQKEVHTKRNKRTMQWGTGEVTFYLDGVDKEFSTIEQLHKAMNPTEPNEQ